MGEDLCLDDLSRRVLVDGFADFGGFLLEEIQGNRRRGWLGRDCREHETLVRLPPHLAHRQVAASSEHVLQSPSAGATTRYLECSAEETDEVVEQCAGLILANFKRSELGDPCVSEGLRK